MRILITAGPTREYIDPVRYLSNESSGKMGFALAAAARRRGHQVVLVAGPVCLPTPKGVERIDVISARDMLAVLRQQFESCDALIMAAAVADFRPRRRLRGKWKAKQESSSPQLDLVENPDLLRTVARRKGSRTVVAFALETSQGKKRARAKLVAKNADWIVLNGAGVLGQDWTSVTLLDRNGNEFEVLNRTKAQVARAVIHLLE